MSRLRAGRGARARERLRRSVRSLAGRSRRLAARTGIVLGALAGGLVLVLALMGLPHVFRGTPIGSVTGLGNGDSIPGFESADFERALRVATGARLEPGATIEILNNGDRLFPGLWRDLRAARRSIAIVSYFGGDGAVADTLAAILAERARNGVAVHWVYDAVGSADLSPAYFVALRSAGVRAVIFRPVRWYSLDRAHHRTHARAIVIDGTIGYTGGFGLDDRWLGDGRSAGQWRDTNVRVTGPPVRQLLELFVRHWADAVGELAVRDPRPGDAGPPAPGPGGSARLATMMASPPDVGGSPAARLIALTIAAASRSLLISNAYFVPDAPYITLLQDARRRGVDVRILTNGPSVDVELTRLAGRRRYTPLLEAGVRIYEYQPTVMHAKTIVADGVWNVIGTINIDNLSLAFNEEVTLLALDAGVGRQMERAFEQDLEHAREITREEFAARSRWKKLFERFADLVWRWL